MDLGPLGACDYKDNSESSRILTDEFDSSSIRLSGAPMIYDRHQLRYNFHPSSENFLS